MDPQEQIKEVQNVLDRLTRFRHLNGWAAVAAGILSLIAYGIICNQFGIPLIRDKVQAFAFIPNTELVVYAMYLGVLLVVSVIVCGTIVLASLPGDLTMYAWRNLLRLIAVYGGYILCGGAVAWAIVHNSEMVSMRMLQTMPSLMCIFYGMSQLHASHISLPALKYLGFILLPCGIIGCFFPAFSWFLWAVGFGLGHIAVGLYVVKNRTA